MAHFKQVISAPVTCFEEGTLKNRRKYVPKTICEEYKSCREKGCVERDENIKRYFFQILLNWIIKNWKISDELPFLVENKTDLLKNQTRQTRQQSLKLKIPQSEDTLPLNTPLELEEESGS